jgi:glutaredoxin
MSYIVYSKDKCVFCTNAKELLTREGLAFEIRDVIAEPRHLHFIKNVKGFATLPQIYEEMPDGTVKHIGGFYDLRTHLKV